MALKRPHTYSPNDSATIKPAVGTSGCVVLLEGSDQKLRRAFHLYPEVLPQGVIFRPANGGTVVVDEDAGQDLPDDNELARIVSAGFVARPKTNALPSRPLTSVGGSSLGGIEAMPFAVVRPFAYRAQDPVTVKPKDGRRCIVLLNVGSEGNEHELMRAFEFEADAFSEHEGVTFVPPSDGMIVIDVDPNADSPSNALLESDVIPSSIEAQLYAGSEPQGVKRRPP